LTGSTATSLNITWIPLLTSAETGNSAILTYNVWWDAGTGSININLFESPTALNYIISSLVPGKNYQFVVRASNIYGYSSAFSDPVTFAPSGVPATMSPITTSLTYPQVVFSFTAPATNGKEITGY